jgi:hypothetical protein
MMVSACYLAMLKLAYGSAQYKVLRFIYIYIYISSIYICGSDMTQIGTQAIILGIQESYI